MRSRFGFVVALAVAAAPAAAQTSSEPSASQDPAKNPPAGAPAPAAPEASPSTLSPELIARGDGVYHGPGNCYACHGAKAEGSVGPNLTDAEWIHSDGTYEGLVKQINTGVTKEQSKSGIPMPAKGGSTISDDDVKAVAAYIHSLGQK